VRARLGSLQEARQQVPAVGRYHVHRMVGYSRAVDPGDRPRHLGEFFHVPGRAQVNAILRAKPRNEFSSRPLSDKPAAVDDPDPRAHSFRLLHVMGRVNDREALPSELLHPFENGVSALRIDTHGRLVKDQELGMIEQPGGDVEAPLHAARVRVEPVVAPIG
jgi:hypothetical protein